MSRLLAAFLSIVLSAISTHALAQSPKAAIDKFGLLGKWAIDCAAQDVALMTFEASFFGAPTLTLKAKSRDLTSGGTDVSDVEWNILSATQVANDEMVITVAVQKQTGNGQPVTLFDVKPMEWAPLRKIGSDRMLTKLPQAIRSITLQKCLN